MTAVRSGFGHASHEGAERWEGLFETREEAIEEAIGCHGFDQEDPHVWICEGSYRKASDFFCGSDRLFEGIAEAAYDEVGDLAEDWPGVDSEKQEELETLIGDWLDKNAPCNFWGVDKIERVELDADGKEKTP